jgi:hypothetical protein
MADNGFMILKEKDWQGQTPEQRDWLIFNTLQNMDSRLKKIESKAWLDKGCSFLGGIVGGAAAYFGIKIGG